MKQKVLIFYFSGTGNARASSCWVREHHLEKGDQVKILSLSEEKKFKEEHAEACDLIYLLYPTHGFNAPPVVLSFLVSVPRQTSHTWILMNTRAGGKIGKCIFTQGLNGLALYFPYILFSLRNQKVRNIRSIDLPSNWISLHPSFGPKAVQSMANREKRRMQKYLREEKHSSNTLRLILESPFDLLVSPIAIPYYIYGRFALAKTFYANHKCTNCGKCIRECPVSAIEWKQGRPFWTLSCESCMQCMGNCPKEAVATAHGITALLWWLALSALPLALFSLLQYAGEPYSTFINHETALAGIIIDFILWLPVSIMGYRILHFLLGFKQVNKWVSYSSLTTYRFWRKYRYTKDH